MFNRFSFRHRSAFLVFGAFSLLAIGLGMAPGVTGTSTDSEMLKTLLDERRTLLEQAVRLASQEYQAGRTDIDSVLELQRDLLNTELELAASREERIKLYEKFVELANHFEKIATERFRSGQGTQVDVLKAKSALLQSKIDLERAKLKDD